MPYIISIISIIFALLNRARGDHFKYFPDTLAKYLSGILCGSLVWFSGGVWWDILGCIILYKIGESFGWGKWISSILTNKPHHDEDEGKTVFKLFGKQVIIWDGIHHIANLFIPEKKNFYAYSMLALSIRGVYWWTPILIYASIRTSLYGSVALLCSLLLGVLFPLSVLLAMQWDWKIPYLIYQKDMINRSWQRSELIYGAFQGLIFGLLFI